MFWIQPCVLRHELKKDKSSENLERKPRQGDKCLDNLKLVGQGQLLAQTSWPEVRATRLDHLPSQRITLGGQELLTIRLVATHIMEDASDLVFVLGVANQAIKRETVH